MQEESKAKGHNLSMNTTLVHIGNMTTVINQGGLMVQLSCLSLVNNGAKIHSRIDLVSLQNTNSYKSKPGLDCDVLSPLLFCFT